MLDKRRLCVLGSKASMATVTLEEKRLKALKQQLFGKSDSSQLMNGKQFTAQTSKAATTTLESINLRTDLMKIFVLSFLAMALQFSLFFMHQRGLIRFF